MTLNKCVSRNDLEQKLEGQNDIYTKCPKVEKSKCLGIEKSKGPNDNGMKCPNFEMTLGEISKSRNNIGIKSQKVKMT